MTPREHIPKKAIIMARISHDREGEYRGVPDQIEDLRGLAARLGWGIQEPPVIEEEVSAYKRRRVTLPNGKKVMRVIRPALRQEFTDGSTPPGILDMLAAGTADGLLAYDMDRAFRDPLDLEDLIMIVEMSRPRIPVLSVTGSLQLGNDSEITMARVMVTMANKASKDTSRRVSRARERRARNGEFGGGRRPYGFLSDGVTVCPEEAAEIVQATRSALSGVPLKAVVRDLNERLIPTAGDTLWTPDGLRAVLLRARNAGIMVHQGEEVGTAPWDPIVPEDQWRAVVAKLTDPSRLTNHSPAPRWLGSGLYQCGTCGAGMRVHSSAEYANRPVYRCSKAGGGGHVTRSVGPLDEYVIWHVVEWCSAHDAPKLLVSRVEGVDVGAVRAEMLTLRTRLDDLAADYVDGAIDKRQLVAGTARHNARNDELKETLKGATQISPLAALIGVEDVRAAWDDLPLGNRRRIIEVLMTVTVLPVPKGVPRGFDPAYVRIEAKGGEST